MSLTRDEGSIRIGEVVVTVLGETDGARARWRLQFDGDDVAEERIMRGEHVLAGQLPDGSAVEATVHQSVVGPTRVEVRHADEVVFSMRASWPEPTCAPTDQARPAIGTRTGPDSRARGLPTSGSAAVDRDLERRADLAHPTIAQRPDPIHQHCDGDALDGVQVRRTTTRNRVIARLEDHLAGEPPDRGRAGGDERPTKPGDGGVAREDDDRSAPDLGQLAPPGFSPPRDVHDDAAASRNEARSPHSSRPSMGWAAYSAA